MAHGNTSDVHLNSLVTKIRFVQNGTTPKAIGVDFLKVKVCIEQILGLDHSPTGSGSVNATREVIISQNFQQPQVLKLSGIGPN